MELAVKTDSTKFKFVIPIALNGVNTPSTRHSVRAAGHIVAALAASAIGDDYNRRTVISVSSENSGLTPVITITPIGINAPSGEELELIVNRAIVEADLTGFTADV